MKDKHGKNLKPGSLIAVNKRVGVRYFYIERLHNDEIWGKRVNKNFSFNQYDKTSGYERPLFIFDYDSIELIDPVPETFLESIRTLHFWTEEVLEDFGEIVNPKFKTMLRAVKFENGSYGIIQNRMYNDMSEINPEYNVMNVFEDLSYEELCEKWEIKKNNSGSEWRK